MKNILGFFTASDVKVSGFQSLSADEMCKVRGGAEPVKPITEPRDRYDDEEQQ
ncbi:MAG: hypothetical protein AB7S72_09175 [Draconibacterium sp.]